MILMTSPTPKVACVGLTVPNSLAMAIYKKRYEAHTDITMDRPVAACNPRTVISQDKHLDFAEDKMEVHNMPTHGKYINRYTLDIALPKFTPPKYLLQISSQSLLLRLIQTLPSPHISHSVLEVADRMAQPSSLNEAVTNMTNKFVNARRELRTAHNVGQ